MSVLLNEVKPQVLSNYTKRFSWNLILNKRSFWTYVFLGLTIWVAHYLLAHKFGLYEDDYFFISPPFGWNFDQLLAKIIGNFEKWPQGRPIGFSLPLLFSFVGYRLGGLYGVYVIAFLILSLNACLVYTLVKMIGSEFSALLAGLAFSLFPPDTTRSFLMHATGLQPSLTFLLIASLFYLSGKPGLSYLIILCSLLTYESPFMVFFGIPLLQHKWGRKFAKELVQHVVILSIMLLCVLIIRHYTGDDRLQIGGEIFFIPIKILISLVIGPLVSIGLFLTMPFTVFFHFDIKVVAIILLSLIVIGWLFFRTVDDPENISADGDGEILFGPWFDAKLAEWKVLLGRGLIRTSIVSMVLICLGYVVSFTHFPPIAYQGRLTSVHLAASLGCSILFACLGSFLLITFNKYLIKYLGVIVLVIYFSLAIGYGVIVQTDLARSWCTQKSFWADALRLTPDLEDNTIIFFPYDDRAEPKYIHVHSWADPIVLEQIYEFPINWQTPPRLFTLDLTWAELIYYNGQQFMWEVPVTTLPAHKELLPVSNLILLQKSGQSLIRVDGNIFIDGQKFSLKSTPSLSASSTVKKGPLYELFMSNNECDSNN